jgi:Protein of unknown function (DUF1499)
MPFGVLARTTPDAGDARLRGRTYGIPFHDVWVAAFKLASSLRRWRVVTSDELTGVIRAEATTLVRKRVSDVEIRIVLDEDAQTRVDMSSESRNGAFDWGVNIRRIGNFFSALDKELAKPRTERLESAH